MPLPPSVQGALRRVPSSYLPLGLGALLALTATQLRSTSRPPPPAPGALPRAEPSSEAPAEAPAEPEGIEVKGRVRSLEGVAVEGALVTVTSADAWRPEAKVATQTDASGAFSVRVPAGEFKVKARMRGYATEERSCFRGAVCPLFLGAESVIAGQVKAAGAPVAGAAISLGDVTASPSLRAATEVVTDAEGRFAIHGLGPGSYRVTASAPGLFGAAAAAFDVGAGETRGDVRIEAGPAFDVSGLVRLAPDGAACPGGRVTLRAPWSRELSEAPIDREGRVRFRSVPPGVHEVVVDCERGQPEPLRTVVRVTDKGAPEQTWSVTRGLEISGRLVDPEGKPVVAMLGAYVPRPYAPDYSPPRATARAEPDGRFVLGHLEKGVTYEARVSLAPSLSAYSENYFELDKGSVSGVELPIRPSDPPKVGRLEGRLVDDRGDPVEGGLVMVDESQEESTFVSSGEGGTFTIPSLAAGTHDITAAREPGQPIGWTRWMKFENGNFEQNLIEVPEDGTAQVTLVVHGAHVPMTGTLEDAEGKPIAGAYIEAMYEAKTEESARPWPIRPHRFWTRQPAITDASGAFSLAHLPDGVYTLRAYRKGGGQAMLRHKRPGDVGTWKLPRGSSLAGQVRLAGDRAAGVALVSATDRDSGVVREVLSAEGAFSLEGLPAGVYDLTAEGEEGTACAEVTLGEGEARAGITLEPRPRTTLRARLVDAATGEPVDDTVWAKPWRRGAPFFAAPAHPEPTSGPKGRLRYEGVPEGWFELRIGASGPMPPHGWLSFLVKARSGGVTDLGDIRLVEVGSNLGFEIADESPAEPDDHLVVSSVDPQGPAAARGMKVGDTIVAVDGKLVRDTPVRYFYSDFQRVPEGRTVALKLGSGKVVRLTAK